MLPQEFSHSAAELLHDDPILLPQHILEDVKNRIRSGWPTVHDPDFSLIVQVAGYTPGYLLTIFS
jgi:hypothetical protein